MGHVVRLTETGPGVTVALTGEQARLLAASGVVDVGPGTAPGLWAVRGRGKVGAAHVGDVEVRIEPKVPGARLLFLLGYARDPRFWRDEPVSLAVAADLVPAFAGALWRQMSRALAAGVLHGYRSVDESSPVLRGRLRETDQLGRHLGRPLPLEIRHDEFTIDIAENRILATAAHRMLRVPGVDDESRPTLFEEFLDSAVREALVRRHGGAVVRQSPHLLDHAGRHHMRADIAWVHSGAVRAVIDAKYKTDTAIDDLYQMLAYCTVLGLGHGHLVYVTGADAATHGVRNSGVEISCHVLDLDQPPSALLDDIDVLVDLVAASAPWYRREPSMAPLPPTA